MLRGMLAQRAGVRFSPELVFYRESAESMYHEVSRYASVTRTRTRTRTRTQHDKTRDR
jgi:hypothetical protein